MNVTEIPLKLLTTPSGIILRKQNDTVTFEGVNRLLSEENVYFVVADVGRPLLWISEEEKFAFWQRDVVPHFARGEEVCLDDYPGGFVYFASWWRSPDMPQTVILLEKHH